MQRRKQTGSFVAELPAVLWLLFVLVTFPLVDLATVSMRYTFMLTTSRDAVSAASRAKTFHEDASATDLSARNAAREIATATAASFNGISISNVHTRIIATNLATNAIEYHDTPLTEPADSTNYLYAFETTVTGQLMPLIIMSTPFGDIPGLTAPMNISISSQKLCENTQGLNQ